MKLYQRVLRVDDRKMGSDDEVLELKEVLSNAPGVAGVEVKGTHPKGGYTVLLDLEAGTVEAFFSHWEGASWRFVM